MYFKLLFTTAVAVVVHTSSAIAGAEPQPGPLASVAGNPLEFGCDGFRCTFAAKKPICHPEAQSATLVVGGMSLELDRRICSADETERYKNPICASTMTIGAPLIPGEKFSLLLKMVDGTVFKQDGLISFSTAGLGPSFVSDNHPEISWRFLKSQSPGEGAEPILAARYIKPSHVVGGLDLVWLFDPCTASSFDRDKDKLETAIEVVGQSLFQMGAVAQAGAPWLRNGTFGDFAFPDLSTPIAISISVKRNGQSAYGPYVYQVDARTLPGWSP